MREIDRKKITDQDLSDVLKQNVLSFRNAERDNSGTFLGEDMRLPVVFEYYGCNQERYEIIDNVLNYLINSELVFKRKIERAKWAKQTNDRALKDFHYNLLKRDMEDRELTVEEKADRAIFYPQSTKEDKDMNDNEIYLHSAELMYKKGIEYLQHEYDQYDLSSDDGLEKLYRDTYSHIGDLMTEIAVELNNSARISELIDMHNILAENDVEIDENNDITIEEDNDYEED